jgi:hypothetical protein
MNQMETGDTFRFHIDTARGCLQREKTPHGSDRG